MPAQDAFLFHEADDARPDSPGASGGERSRFVSWLTPECKMSLAAAVAGYLLCLWQAMCVSWPLPHLGLVRGFDEPAWRGPRAEEIFEQRRAMLATLAAAPRRVGEVRHKIHSHVVRHAVDFDDFHPDDPDAWAKVAQVRLWGKSRAVTRPSPTYTLVSLLPAPRPDGRPRFTAPPGALAARFESGPDGVAAVGHTRGGGTSYGAFQIAAGTPTFNNFLRFLEARAPDWQARLKKQGPADTGSTAGDMPEEWRRIAQEDPRRFERLQYEFILNTHYRPAVADIYEETGVDISALSPATREVLWSAVVQHGAGGGAGIFVAAINVLKNRVVDEKRLSLFEQALIEEVYACRIKSFGGNPRTMRSAMTSRYMREKRQALGILERHCDSGS